MHLEDQPRGDPQKTAISSPSLLTFLASLYFGNAHEEEVETDYLDEGWAYGGYLDLSYAESLDRFTQNYPWRTKLSSTHLNASEPNMDMAYILKNPSKASRWGMEFGVHAGADVQGQSH